MPSRTRIAAALVAAVAFGVFAGWAKGPATDGLSLLAQVRSALGNLSTPWVLVAFVAGAITPRLRLAAVLGLTTTIAALLGFYMITALLVDLGGDSYLANLRIELLANRVWFQAALLSGPTFGVLGAWWTRSQRSALLAAGLLLMAEPVVLFGLGLAFPGGVLDFSLPAVLRVLPGWGISAGSGAARLFVYGAEFVVGLALTGWAYLAVTGSHRFHPTRSS